MYVPTAGWNTTYIARPRHFLAESDGFLSSGGPVHVGRQGENINSLMLNRGTQDPVQPCSTTSELANTPPTQTHQPASWIQATDASFNSMLLRLCRTHQDSSTIHMLENDPGDLVKKFKCRVLTSLPVKSSYKPSLFYPQAFNQWHTSII
ncbi:hypothetical protein C8F01DRAFT_1237128 [Mycena amicta]|nr:hypothetical protein C8F01DRAFT_1237128 [Mycena amicta]